MKMDIEGGELRALRGFQSSIAQGCREIYCELHPLGSTDVPNALTAGEVEDIKDILRGAGFEVNRIDVRGQPFLKATRT